MIDIQDNSKTVNITEILTENEWEDFMKQLDKYEDEIFVLQEKIKELENGEISIE